MAALLISIAVSVVHCDGIVWYRILIISNVSYLVDYLEHHFKENDYLVETIPDPETGVRLIQEKQFHAIVLGWQLADVQLLDGVKLLRLHKIRLPIIVLLNDDSTQERISHLNAGANDCLSSPFDMQELLLRLRIHLRQCSWQGHPNLLTFEDVTVDLESRQVFRGDRNIELTAREFELLAYFMQHPHQVLTRNQILETIWGYDFVGTSNIVDVYVRYLRNKLEKHQGKRLIHTVRYVGYVLRT